MSEISQVTLDQGTVRYTDSGGDGPAVVLVHGVLVDGSLWRDVVGPLSEHARVVVPELPLGSHQIALRPDADLSPPGVARLIADFLAALELRNVTLVGNDTGGAMCQLVATRHPERLAGLVLTNCDTHENFLPPAFRPVQLVARVPGGLWLLGQAMRVRALRRLPVAYGWLTSKPLDPERDRAWVRPVATDPGVRRDVAKVLRGIHPRYTLEAARRLREFPHPAMLVWGTGDRFFTAEHARRLVEEFAGIRVEWVENCATFVPVDAPDRLSCLVGDFVRRDVPSR